MVGLEISCEGEAPIRFMNMWGEWPSSQSHTTQSVTSMNLPRPLHPGFSAGYKLCGVGLQRVQRVELLHSPRVVPH